MTTFYVYRNAHDAPTTIDADDTDAAADAACDNDPRAEYDCISDHVQIVYTRDDVIVVARDPQTDIVLRDIYH